MDPNMGKATGKSPENAFCNTQVAEAPCTTFNSLVPALLQSGTGEPRHEIPLYSLPLRLTVVKIRPFASPFRRLPRYSVCAPPKLTSYHHACLPLPTSTALCHSFSGPWPHKMQRHNATFRKKTNQAKKRNHGTLQAQKEISRDPHIAVAEKYWCTMVPFFGTRYTFLLVLTLYHNHCQRLFFFKKNIYFKTTPFEYPTAWWLGPPSARKIKNTTIHFLSPGYFLPPNCIMSVLSDKPSLYAHRWHEGQAELVMRTGDMKDTWRTRL